MKKALTILTLVLLLSVFGFTQNLAVVINALGARESTITIFKQYAVTNDLTIPANITLEFLQGGSVTITAAKTLTINGPIEAGLFQIFEGDGSVVFGSGSVREVYPQWWGAKADGTTDDTDAIQEAINVAQASTYHPVVFIPAGRYLVVGTLNILGDQNTLMGAGIRSTFLYHDPAAPNTRCLVIEKAPGSKDDFNEIKDFMIWANDANSSYLLSVINQASFIAENIYLHGNALSVPFTGNDLVHANFKTVHFKKSSSDGAIIPVGTGVNTTTVFDNCYFTNNLRYGARFDKAISLTIKNSIIESNEDVGLVLANTEYVEIALMGNHFENNTNGVIVAGADMARKTKIHSTDNTYYGKPGTVNLISLDNVDFYSKDLFFINYDNRIVKTANTNYHEETEFSELNFGVPTKLTVAVGVITITKSYHLIDGEGDADDNLDTINGFIDGTILILQAEDDAVTITIRDKGVGGGNVETEGDAAIVLDDVEDKAYLFYDATNSVWVEINRFTG